MKIGKRVTVQKCFVPYFRNAVVQSADRSQSSATAKGRARYFGDAFWEPCADKIQARAEDFLSEVGHAAGKNDARYVRLPASASAVDFVC